MSDVWVVERLVRGPVGWLWVAEATHFYARQAKTHAARLREAGEVTRVVRLV